jgi:hypothetical protein
MYTAQMTFPHGIHTVEHDTTLATSMCNTISISTIFLVTGSMFAFANASMSIAKALALLAFRTSFKDTLFTATVGTAETTALGTLGAILKLAPSTA